MEKGSIDKDEMTTSLSMLAHLHHTHLSPTSPSPVPLTPDPDPSLTAALSSSLSPSEQWAYLRESGVVQKLYLQIYQILEETYYPQYCQSEQVCVPFPYIHNLMFPYFHSAFLPVLFQVFGTAFKWIQR